MKKLLCLMICASLFAVSAEAAPAKPAAAKAAKTAMKKDKAPVKVANPTAENSRGSHAPANNNSIRKPLYGWSQDSTVK